MPSKTLKEIEMRGVERLRCPEHFQARINEVAGFNRYGEPNFRLAWAQTETMRQGGEWEAEGEWFRGYRDCYLGDGLPHWMLLQWVDAGKSAEMPHLRAQSDVAFYAENRDPKTQLQILGEYPYHGSYKVALPLVAKWFEFGRLNIRSFPLSSEIVEMMIPIIRASMKVSLEAKMRFLREEEERSDDEYARTVDDLYRSVRRRPELAATSWLEDKQRSIEKHFNAALILKMHRDRVFQSQHRLH